MVRKIRSLLFQLKFAKAKKGLNDAIAKSAALTEKNNLGYLQLKTTLEKYDYHAHDAFMNLSIYSNVVELDLVILLADIHNSKLIHAKKLYARIIAVTIVDYIEKVNTLLGRDCLAELKEHDLHEFVDDLKLINKDFGNFKKVNDKLLRTIRNQTLAHKDSNAVSLLNSIDEIDYYAIFDLGLEIRVYGTKFVELSTKVINALVSRLTF